MPVRVRTIFEFRFLKPELSSGCSIAPRDQPDRRSGVRDRRRRQVAAERDRGRDERPWPQQRAGIEDRVAADLSPVAHDGAELAQPGLVGAFRRADDNRRLVEPEVGTDRAGAKVGSVAQDGIADVIEMRDLGTVHQQAILELARVAEHAAFADDDVAPDEGARTDVGVGPDPDRADQGRVGWQFDRRMQPDETLDAHAG